MRRKKKKKNQDVKEWRKRKKQGAEKKKRVNHKNSDLQEWVGRRKEDGGGEEKCKSQTGVPPCGWRREATVPTVALPHPSCSTSLHPECQTASCNPVWCSCQATKHSHSNTHMHARTHTRKPQNALLEQLDPNVHACSDTYSTFNAQWLAEFGFLSTQTTRWYAQTHAGTHTHTHAQTLHLMRGKRRERGRRRLKSRTEQQHGFVDVRRLLLRLSDSQCPQALFVVVRKSTCLFRIFYVIGQKNLRKKKKRYYFTP